MPLYALGSNGAGQLGIGHLGDVAAPTPHLQPSKLNNKTSPSRIVAGGNHTLIRYSSGHISITGRTFSPERTLESSILHNDAKLCSATWDTSIISTKDEMVLACGKGDRGELGLGPDVHEIEDLSPVKGLPTGKSTGLSIVDLASGVYHTVIVLSNGEVWGWGNGRKGQLGEPSGIIWEPRKVIGLDFEVKRAVCGREFTYLVGDPSEGRHALLGPDKWNIKSTAPSCVPGWKTIGASWGSIHILFVSGDLVSWGRNDHGQLAPAGSPRIREIAIGSEHAVALTTDGEAISWGWGEHGNCGIEVDGDGDVKHRYNTLSLPSSENSSIVGVGAGCATSWIWT